MGPSLQYAHLDSFEPLFFFVTCVVIFSANLANSFSSASFFECPYFSQLRPIKGRNWYLYKVISDGFPGMDYIWLFSHVKGKKYSRSVRVP